MRKIYFILTGLLLLAACEDPFDSANDTIPDSFIKNSTIYFPGEVIETSSAILNGIQLWQVTVENESGAIVNFFWRKSISNLHKIEGTTGPFDYNLKPPFDVINFAAARFLATNNFSIGNITSWSFEPTPKQNMKWYYIFQGDGAESKVMLDAGSGSVIR
ncbi:MAG: hypothetical protein U5K79_20915 [Cyclobacteriaceae bacterium]|nr:hypothetical protein [Cyclobacteriaceae bacterium]